MFCVMICRRSVIDSASSKVWNFGLLSLSLAEVTLVEVRNENSCLDRSPVLGMIKVPFLNFCPTYQILTMGATMTFIHTGFIPFAGMGVS